MIGAIIGDIVGSRFEFNNHRSKELDLFGPGCFATDDSIMTLAVAQALLDANGNTEKLKQITALTMQRIGRPYPSCGYGGRFYVWMYSDDP
ncbi:MAG: ADP-ribosylglycohydrolase family protein, partial [Pyramidobacter sp.]|nr:ADP-ribosylglycohydrolase family protein [Pyramidobacter sp.]